MYDFILNRFELLFDINDLINPCVVLHFILINLLCVDTETEAIEIGPETETPAPLILPRTPFACIITSTNNTDVVANLSL